MLDHQVARTAVAEGQTKSAGGSARAADDAAQPATDAAQELAAAVASGDLRAARELLDDDGFACYMGLPDFRAVARNYLNGSDGILGPTFDLYHVYRYTHGDPEGVDHYFEQLHKSLFHVEEVERLLDEAGYPSFVAYTYIYPREHTAVTMGFYASAAAKPREQLIRQASDFLRLFDGRFSATRRFGLRTARRRKPNQR